MDYVSGNLRLRRGKLPSSLGIYQQLGLYFLGYSSRRGGSLFEPTGANGMVGSYTSLSVCLSVCLSGWVYPGHIIHHYNGIWATYAHGIRSDLAIEPGASIRQITVHVGGLTSKSSCIFYHIFAADLPTVP